MVRKVAFLQLALVLWTSLLPLGWKLKNADGKNSMRVNPGRLTWNIIIEVWFRSFSFLFMGDLYVPAVHLPGCIHPNQIGRWSNLTMKYFVSNGGWFNHQLYRWVLVVIFCLFVGRGKRSCLSSHELVPYPWTLGILAKTETENGEFLEALQKPCEFRRWTKKHPNRSSFDVRWSNPLGGREGYHKSKVARHLHISFNPWNKLKS